MDVASIAAILQRRLNCRGDLCAVLPWPKRQVMKFVETHADELAAMLGKGLRVVHSDYHPSGRGAFGRSKGGARAKYVKAAIYWRQ